MAAASPAVGAPLLAGGPRGAGGGAGPAQKIKPSTETPPTDTFSDAAAVFKQGPVLGAHQTLAPARPGRRTLGRPRRSAEARTAACRYSGVSRSTWASAARTRRAADALFARSSSDSEASRRSKRCGARLASTARGPLPRPRPSRLGALAVGRGPARAAHVRRPGLVTAGPSSRAKTTRRRSSTEPQGTPGLRSASVMCLPPPVWFWSQTCIGHQRHRPRFTTLCPLFLFTPHLVHYRTL